MMIDIIIVILGIITAILAFLLIFRFIIQYMKSKTELNQLIMYFFICIGIGLVYDCVRILTFLYFGSIIEFVDQLFFVMKVLLIFISTFLIFQLAFIFNRQSGQKMESESTIKFINLIGIGVFSFVNFFTFTITNMNELGFYSYQIHEILSYITYAFYLPLFIFMFFKARLFISEIKDKTFSNHILFLTIIVLATLIERFISNAHYTIIPYSVQFIVIDLLTITVLGTITLLMIFKNPEFLEALSTYYSVRSIYLISKKGGQVIFRHNFQIPDEETVLPDQLLLGGFIYAITSGLEATLQMEGKMEAIRVGDIFIIFKHGKNILGIVFATYETSILHLKLHMLMQRFESYYSSILNNWVGDLTQFDSGILQEWVIEIFKKVL